MPLGKFSEILMVGGHANSLGRAGEVVEEVLVNPSRLDELYSCISDDDAWVRMRAIDAFEKVIRKHPEWANPYLEDMLTRLTTSDQASIQWHLAELFMRVDLSGRQQKQAAEWLMSLLKTVEVDWIVAINSIRALMQFAELGLVPADELGKLFTIQEQHKSKTVRKKAAQFRDEVD
jgi:HEAT repeat protein